MNNSRMIKYKEYEARAAELPDITEACTRVWENHKTAALSFVRSVGHDMALYGDTFIELVGPHDLDRSSDLPGVWNGKVAEETFRPLVASVLPPPTMYSVRTIHGEVVEYQHGGLDYACLSVPIWSWRPGPVIRFEPWRLIHGKNRSDLAGAGYGISALETYDAGLFEAELAAVIGQVARRLALSTTPTL